MKTLLSFVLCIFFSSFAFAQSKVVGTVTDEKGEAMPYVNVLLLNVKDSALVKGAVSDDNGKYSIEAKAGKYLVSTRMTGYKTSFTAPFEANGTEISLETIKMEQAAMQLKEVGVVATRPMIEVKGNTMVMNVSSSAILSTGSAHDVLSKSPGISIDQDGRMSLKGKQNVMVMIDGKLTYLSGDEVIRLLQNTPAANIESVEIMDTPPAKYDAAGNAGMVNIKMKKDKNLGFNGGINLMGGWGKYGKATTGVNFNYRQKFFNIFGNANYNFNERYQILSLYRNVPSGNNLTSIFDQSQYIHQTSKNASVRLGADFFLDPKTTIGVLVNANLGNVLVDNAGTTNLLGNVTQPYNLLKAQTDLKDEWKNVSANINFKRSFGKAGELSIDADYSSWNRLGAQNSLNNFFFKETNASANLAPVDLRTKTDAIVKISAFKADYTLPFTKQGNLELGVKSSLVQTDNDLNFKRNENGQLVNDDRSNHFTYDEQINAGYVNYSKKIKKWSIQLGLRGENTASDGYSVTLNQRNKRDYFNLFPSASISYTEDKKYSLAASYSRRIDRPNYQQLNPFIFFLDQFTYQVGNPFLNPQYTDAYSLTYGYKGFAFLTLSYNKTTALITQVFGVDVVKQAGYVTTENLNSMDNYSMNLTLPMPLTKWWMMNANLTGFYNRIQSPFIDGSQIDNAQATFMGNVTNTFTLPQGFKLELTGNYQSAMIWSTLRIQPQYQIDLGVSKTVGKFNVRASLTDVFKSRIMRATIQQGILNNTMNNVWENQIFRLNVGYNFGSKDVKASRRRSTGIDDLQRRANSGN